MSTHDYVIANASGSSVRSDLNNALAAIVSNNSSSSEPSTKYAYMLWVDTTNNLIKLRNSANNAWITLFTTAGGLDVDAASNFNEDVTFTGANNNVTWDKSADDLIFNDNAKAVFGTSSDGLEIYHTGSTSTIKDTGTGNLNFQASHYDFINAAGNEYLARFYIDGPVQLYFDHVLTFTTISTGAEVHGPTGDVGRLRVIGKEGRSAELQLWADDGDDYTDICRIHQSTNGNLYIQNNTASSTWEDLILATPNGAVSLSFDGNPRLKTTVSGIEVEYNAAATEAAPQLLIDGYGYDGRHWLDNNSYYIGQNSDTRSLRIYSGTDTGDYVQLTAGGNSWTGSSDERLKEDIKDIGSVIDKVKDIRCVTYKLKNRETPKETIGFIAQDFIGKFDQVLDQSITIKDDDTEYYGIKYTETIPILLKAIQELSAKIAALEAK